MRKVKAKSAQLVRLYLVYMLWLHALFILLELFYYYLVPKVLIFELFYTWLAYYSLMTLYWWSTNLYIGTMALAPIIGIYSVDQVSRYYLFTSIVYTLQLGIYAFFGVYKLQGPWREWLTAKKENQQQLEEKKAWEK